jgi:hypothetical protein
VIVICLFHYGAVIHDLVHQVSDPLGQIILGIKPVYVDPRYVNQMLSVGHVIPQ